MSGILGVYPCVGAVSVCIGDPMGFALDPLDPLEQGVALDLVVALDPVVYFSHNQHLSKVYKGYVLTPKYDDCDPNYGR